MYSKIRQTQLYYALYLRCMYYCHGILFIPSSYCKELILRMNSTSPYRSTFGLPHLYFLILNPGVLQTCHGPLDMKPIISVHKQSGESN